MNRICVVIAILAVAGCYSGGVKVTEKQIQAFKPGVTTYAQVVKDLGPPTTVTAKSDGTRSATYTYVMAKAKAASFIPVVGIFAGGADTRTTNTTFNFDKAGTLIDFSTSDSSVGAGMGTTGRATPRDAEDAQPAVAQPKPLSATCSDGGEMRCNANVVETCRNARWEKSDDCSARGMRCSTSQLHCSVMSGEACCY
jgi:hypothetical protein